MGRITIFVVLLMAAGVVLGQTPTPGNLTDYLNTLTEEQRSTLFRSSAKEGSYFPGVDYCPHLEEAADLELYFAASFEPFGSVCINTLAAQISTLSGREALRAAAILYRYAHAAGRAYLIEAVEQRSDPTAAAILSMNHESDVLDRIVAALRQTKYPPLELVASLASWGQPAASAGVLERFQKNPENSDLMMGVGVAGLVEAVGALQAQHQDAPANDSRKIAAAGALARLGTDRNDHLQFLVGQLSAPPPSERWRLEVVAALGLAGGAEAEAALNGVIDQYTNTNAIPGVSTETAATMAVLAAKSLAYLNAQGSVANVEALFQKLAGPVEVSGIDRKRGVVGNVLLDLDPTGAQDTIRNALGEPWLQRLLAARTLQRLPHSLVPKKTKDLDHCKECFWSPN